MEATEIPRLPNGDWIVWTSVFILLACTPGTICEYPVSPQSQLLLSTCSGTSATFGWTYIPETPQPDTITWLKKNSDGTAATLAVYSFAAFTVDPAYTGRVIRVNTGTIVLSNISSSDDGNYEIEVFDAVDSKTTTGSAILTNQEQPLLEGGGVTATCNESVVTCTGVSSHGIPPTTLTVSHESFSGSTSTDLTISTTLTSKKTVYCELTGAATQCLSGTPRLNHSVECGPCICQCSCNSKTRNGAFLGVAVVVLIFWIIFLILLILNFKCSSKARSRESASRGRTGDPTSRGRTGDPTSRGCTASRRSSCASTSSDCSDNRKLKVIICIVILVIFLIIGIVFAVVIGVCPTVRNEIKVSGQECCCSSCDPNGNMEKKECERVEIAALVCCILWIILIVVVVIVVIVKCKKVIVSVVCSKSGKGRVNQKTNQEDIGLTESGDATNKESQKDPPKVTADNTPATEKAHETTDGSTYDNTTENNSKGNFNKSSKLNQTVRQEESSPSNAGVTTETTTPAGYETLSSQSRVAKQEDKPYEKLTSDTSKLETKQLQATILKYLIT